MRNFDDGKNFFSGVLIGGLLGAILGILYAPKAGEETRRELKEKAEGWKKEGMKYADKWSRQAKTGITEAKRRTKRAAEELTK